MVIRMMMLMMTTMMMVMIMMMMMMMMMMMILMLLIVLVMTLMMLMTTSPPQATSCKPEDDPCRAAAGLCDLPEQCNDGVCPVDGFRPQGYVCARGGECKHDAVCSGSSAACPALLNVRDGTTCSGGGVCTNGQCQVGAPGENLMCS
jgi:hypothetical protein